MKLQRQASLKHFLKTASLPIRQFTVSQNTSRVLNTYFGYICMFFIP